MISCKLATFFHAMGLIVFGLVLVWAAFDACEWLSIKIKRMRKDEYNG